ncbi:MAG TPA: leucyl/phenylalanyl-tRNA--protein transferase [Spirochaetota bacterium]|nr:leucyl/phenylalanyl-tRNA--protein transferase [Spirochaetota bacterium]
MLSFSSKQNQALNKSPCFPDRLTPDIRGRVAVGGELDTDILLEAYSKGIFPWFEHEPVEWYAPDPRMVLFPSEFHVSTSFKRFLKKTSLTLAYDTDFDKIIRFCAAVTRPNQHGTWINNRMIAAYSTLFQQGYVHCAGVYEKGELKGGLYGVTLGRVFFGESMFSLVSNASKFALYNLCSRLQQWQFKIIDCQVYTDHLASLGGRLISSKVFNNIIKTGINYKTITTNWQQKV